MRLFIDNPNKDLTEIRCNETGILLGWMPNFRNHEPFLYIPAHPKSALPSVYATDHCDLTNYPIKLRNIRLQYDPLFFGKNAIATYSVERTDWSELIGKNEL